MATPKLSYDFRYDDDMVREELAKEPLSRWRGVRKALAPSDSELLMALAMAEQLQNSDWDDDYVGGKPMQFISDELRAEVMSALAERLEP